MAVTKAYIVINTSGYDFFNQSIVSSPSITTE